MAMTVEQLVEYIIGNGNCSKNNIVSWDVTPCGSCKNQRFGGTERLLHKGDKNR
jgi:hypothetical protein